MSDENSNSSYAGTLVSLACLGVGLALFVIAWLAGDRTAASQDTQWQVVFLGLALAIAGQWMMNHSPTAKKHIITASCGILALVGIVLQIKYDLTWAQCSPFVAAYLFFGVSTEIFVKADTSAASVAKVLQALRFVAVIWNVAWVTYYVGASNMQLPDLVNLYIAFSGIWTFATAIVAWSEYGVAMESGAPRDGPRVFRSLDVRALRIFADLRRRDLERRVVEAL